MIMTRYSSRAFTAVTITDFSLTQKNLLKKLSDRLVAYLAELLGEVTAKNLKSQGV